MSDAEYQCLTIGDFELLLGDHTRGPVALAVAEAAEGYRFAYRNLDQGETDAALRQIDRNSRQATPLNFTNLGHWTHQWERAWQRFNNSKFDLGALRPCYLGKHTPLRYSGAFIEPADELFEAKSLEVILCWVQRKFFEGLSTVYEFGCGSGHNLVTLARHFPGVEFCGFDWAPASPKILQKVRKVHGLRVWGERRNLLEGFPSEDPSRRPFGVLTVGALEQTGLEYTRFFDAMLAARPARVVHLEPMVEFYNHHTAMGHASIKYHLRRGYWAGGLAYLEALEREGRIELLRTRRVTFGSLNVEGYNHIVWRPK